MTSAWERPNMGLSQKSFYRKERKGFTQRTQIENCLKSNLCDLCVKSLRTLR